MSAREVLAEVVFAWDVSDNPNDPSWDRLTDAQRDVWLSAADAILASDWLAKERAELGAKVLEGGVGLIAAERRRQVSAEHYFVEDDDKHTEDQLSLAAASYVLPDRLRAHRLTAFAVRICPLFWPWAPRYWKPTPEDRTRELVKAGALIVADIDRIARATTTTEVGT